MEKSSVQEEKRRLRTALRAYLRNVEEDSLRRSDEALFEAFFALPSLAQAKTVFLYYGVGQEPKTESLLPKLLAQGKQVAFPRCLPERQMEARLVQSTADLLPDVLGIPAPMQHCPILEKGEIDLIVVPALCCDHARNRLGQGGGYYDRYLADYAGVSLAFCRDALLQERLPREDFDQQLNFVLTETRMLV